MIPSCPVIVLVNQHSGIWLSLRACSSVRCVLVQVVVKVFENVLLIGFFDLHPGVLEDLIKWKSLFRVSYEQLIDKAFEFITEVTFSIVRDMLLPEWILIIAKERSVARVFGFSFIEGNVLWAHHEEYYATGKDVSSRSLILILDPKLRCHILRCSQPSCRETLLRCASKWASETEICDFDIEVLINEAILGFQVSVCHVVLVHEWNWIYDLLEEVFA